MNRQEHLLVIAAEECAELAQRLIKASRFGLDQVQPESHEDGRTDTSTNPERLSNRARIKREHAHVYAALSMLDLHGISTDEVLAKTAKVERYLEVSRQNGTLLP
jgi:hypothetical protein